MSEDRETSLSVGPGERGHSLATGIVTYDDVRKKRLEGEVALERIADLLKIQVRHANEDAYAGRRSIGIICDGVLSLNPTLVRNGLRRAIGKKISLAELLRAQYEQFVGDRDKLREHLQTAEKRIDDLYKHLAENAAERRDLAGKKQELTGGIEGLAKEILGLKERRAGIADSDAETNDQKYADLDGEYADKKRQINAAKNALQRVEATLSIKRETWDLLQILSEETEQQVPYYISLVEAANGRVHQADLIIEGQLASLEGVDAVVQALADFSQVRAILDYSSEVLTTFSDHMGELTAYLTDTPLIDEAVLSKRVGGIRRLAEQARMEGECVASGKESELSNMGLIDCYAELGLDLTATAGDVEEARKKLIVQGGHPDVADPDLPEDVKTRNFQRIEYAAKVVRGFMDLSSRVGGKHRMSSKSTLRGKPKLSSKSISKSE